MLNMTSANIEKAMILVVDDNPINLTILLDQLTRMGFNVRIAEDGRDALNHANNEPPDLILLDIVMPGMDGFEVCRELKKNWKLKDVPVIFMTALTDVDNKIKGFDAGAVDYVTKPFHQGELLSRIKLHLTLRRQQKALEEALARVSTLSGLLPICANCKKIRNDHGYWEQVEEYIETHTDAKFSHGVCPECARKLYPDYYKK